MLTVDKFVSENTYLRVSTSCSGNLASCSVCFTSFKWQWDKIKCSFVKQYSV